MQIFCKAVFMFNAVICNYSFLFKVILTAVSFITYADNI